MKIDFLTPSQLQYPGLQVGMCQQGTVVGGSAVITNGGFQSAPRDGLFNSMFTPDDLPYPLPFMQQAALVQQQCPTNQGNAATTTTPQQPTTQSAPSTTAPPLSAGVPASSTTAPAGAAQSTESAATLPQQIIINVSAAAPSAAASCPVAPASASASAAGNQTAASSPSAGADSNFTATAPVPAPVAPIAPVVAAPFVRRPINGMPVVGSTPRPATDKIVTAYAFNPRLRSRTPKAQEQLLEEWLGEQISLRMISAHSAPVAFVVPDGFNAVDFYVGAIELNPEHGETDDLDQIVTLGDVKLSANAHGGAGALNAGDQITVTVPWRYASWVEMAPEHLRVLVTARFYTIENF